MASPLADIDREAPPPADRPDPRREVPRVWWDPGRQLVRAIRAYQRHAGRRNPLSWVLKQCAVMRYRFWSVVSGAEVPLRTRLGVGLRLPHPNGIVIHPEAEIGPNCMIFQQVTLGAGPVPGFPRLGGRVDVGAGAKVLGGVTIGDYARIGANSVVLSDVPAHCTAVGIPAKILPPKEPT